MNVFINIVISALVLIFLQNLIFERALGVNILLYAAQKKENVIKFSIMITYITTISSSVIWVLDSRLGELPYYHIIMPLLYILTISVIYIASLVIIWIYFPKLFKMIKAYVHLSVFNCSVLGALFLASTYGGNLIGYIGYGFGTGLGFLFAGYLLYMAHPRLNSELIPAAFRGIPIMLVYIGVISLALYGFIGYTTGIN